MWGGGRGHHPPHGSRGSQQGAGLRAATLPLLLQLLQRAPGAIPELRGTGSWRGGSTGTSAPRGLDRSRAGPRALPGQEELAGAAGRGGTRFPPAAAPLSDFPRRREAGQARGTPGAVVPGPAQLAHGGGCPWGGGPPAAPASPPARSPGHACASARAARLSSWASPDPASPPCSGSPRAPLPPASRRQKDGYAAGPGAAHPGRLLTAPLLPAAGLAGTHGCHGHAGHLAPALLCLDEPSSSWGAWLGPSTTPRALGGAQRVSVTSARAWGQPSPWGWAHRCGAGHLGLAMQLHVPSSATTWGGHTSPHNLPEPCTCGAGGSCTPCTPHSGLCGPHSPQGTRAGCRNQHASSRLLFPTTRSALGAPPLVPPPGSAPGKEPAPCAQHRGTARDVPVPGEAVSGAGAAASRGGGERFT